MTVTKNHTSVRSWITTSWSRSFRADMVLILMIEHTLPSGSGKKPAWCSTCLFLVWIRTIYGGPLHLGPRTDFLISELLFWGALFFIFFSRNEFSSGLINSHEDTQRYMIHPCLRSTESRGLQLSNAATCSRRKYGWRGGQRWEKRRHQNILNLAGGEVSSPGLLGILHIWYQ